MDLIRIIITKPRWHDFIRNPAWRKLRMDYLSFNPFRSARIWSFSIKGVGVPAERSKFPVSKTAKPGQIALQGVSYGLLQSFDDSCFGRAQPLLHIRPDLCNEMVDLFPAIVGRGIEWRRIGLKFRPSGLEDSGSFPKMLLLRTCEAILPAYQCLIAPWRRNKFCIASLSRRQPDGVIAQPKCNARRRLKLQFQIHALSTHFV